MSSPESGERLTVARVRLAAAPAGPPLEQLRAGGADDQQRHRARAVGEQVDEVEQRVVGPVHVLEHEDGRAVLRQRLEEAPPGRERLRRGRPRRRARRPRPGRPAGAGGARPSGGRAPRRARAETASRSFSPATAAPSDSRMPACALTISPSAQNATPDAVRRATGRCRQVIEVGERARCGRRARRRVASCRSRAAPMSVTSSRRRLASASDRTGCAAGRPRVHARPERARRAPAPGTSERGSSASHAGTALLPCPSPRPSRRPRSG